MFWMILGSFLGELLALVVVVLIISFVTTKDEETDDPIEDADFPNNKELSETINRLNECLKQIEGSSNKES